MYTIIEASKHLGLELQGATVAVQGFGNVGFHAARLLHELGCKIVAVSDSKGAIYNPEGLSPTEILEHKNKTGSVTGYKGCESLSNDELLELKCDILIPSALENQITQANANKIKAKIVAEGANGPTTPDADEALFRNGVFVIPDILANFGGVIVSYFELVQNQMNYYWTEQEVRSRLENTIVTAFKDVLKVGQQYKVSMRIAAYMNAVKRIAGAMSFRNRETSVPTVEPRSVAAK